MKDKRHVWVPFLITIYDRTSDILLAGVREIRGPIKKIAQLQNIRPSTNVERPYNVLSCNFSETAELVAAYTVYMENISHSVLPFVSASSTGDAPRLQTVSNFPLRTAARCRLQADTVCTRVYALCLCNGVNHHSICSRQDPPNPRPSSGVARKWEGRGHRSSFRTVDFASPLTPSFGRYSVTSSYEGTHTYS